MSIRHSRQRGFSLVELMISLTLGSILTAAIVQLFVANADTYNMLQGQSRMQESARFALNFIGRSVRKAGYRGCFSSNAQLNTTINPADNLPYEFDLRTGVAGYNYDTITSAWVPVLDDLPATVGGTDTNVFSTPAGGGVGNGIDTSAIAEGTDVLTLRNMSLRDYRLADDMSSSALDPAIATSDFEFEEDHLVMIHDCEKATIFRITSMNGDTPSAGETSLSHDIADTDATRNNTQLLAIVNSFQQDAAISAIETNIYYIAPGTGVNESGNTPLSLWRKAGMNAPTELVEGIESLQVLYGVDTADDGTAPNHYLSADEVADWTAVETIRVSVVVNSIDDVGGTSTPTLGCTVQDCIAGQSFDGLIRRTFTQTFQLRNQS
ncbi:MAG: PilW family protein [Pseudomonadota bacterium]